MAEEKQNFEDSLKKLERLVAFCTAELETIRQRIEKVTSVAPPLVEPMDILK